MNRNRVQLLSSVSHNALFVAMMRNESSSKVLTLNPGRPIRRQRMA